MALLPADPDLFDSMSSTNPLVRIGTDELRAALWPPTIGDDAPQDAPWRGFQWFFSLDDGTLGAITNHDDAADCWKVWSVKPAQCRRVLDALLDHLRTAGFPIAAG